MYINSYDNYTGVDRRRWTGDRLRFIVSSSWHLSISQQKARYVKKAGWPVTRSTPEVGTYIL